MTDQQTVYIIDDDEAIRDGMEMLLASIGLNAKSFVNGQEFLKEFNDDMKGCIVLDIRMPKMSGLELQLKLKELNSLLPIIFITGHGDIPMAVEAMRNGAIDFIRKPFNDQNLIDRINEALALNSKQNASIDNKQKEVRKISLLSNREKEVFNLVTEGAMNKMIASELNISERTVEVHRSHVMEKLGAKTLAQLVRIKILSEQ
ncbi:MULTISPECIES: response regulator transcription factor [Aliiglaciecola]|uniref:response regulator transcription factor n=1 Tax=Aliiglaciecola TaxID=1406885 RepID=UPI001C09737E|nr:MULTISPECIES: response regulator [Aliiglaciecola]MBU2876341.1 response regulator [Aliiglaciecola lipolytica]MDO6710557.1 response regulator [Aliiglaciecola sp. 2_MG-2023]MDO6751578.1 response regulator [Aliiglaciecola sp. 1_MG-2023]